ncbi:FAD binding domain of DNA photolyase [uncultured archaeon]|nr:FAD binding domain of DNA photolyase [uncultured archaeon]
MQGKTLFIFRRDLRLDDNMGLIAALSDSSEVVPCFIFDPAQRKGGYFSQNAFQFMCESLAWLDRALRARGSRLFLFRGKPEGIVARLVRQEGISAVYANGDYTPFAQARDRRISLACGKAGAQFRLFHDALLHWPDEILKPDGSPYTVFTPYFRAASRILPSRPARNRRSNYFRGKIRGEGGLPVCKANPNIAFRGGRTEALRLLARMGEQDDYAAKRDFPSLGSTTHLSAHLKFGTVSAREAYWAAEGKLGAAHPLIRQFHWRDFFTQVAFHRPGVFGHPFNPRYSGVRWTGGKAELEAWKRGMTGFPIVDAGMRELASTGYMHNRVRMIAASFLTKDLHVDWREGEKHFAQKLADYDPCVNNGNWQWAASTGCDAQPYFRIFNPWLQQRKFDPSCEYIKRWVPELSGLSAHRIHSLEKEEPPAGYPRRMVEHAREAAVAKAAFRGGRG